MKPSVSAMSPSVILSAHSVILSEAKDLMPIASGVPVASGDEVLRYAQDDKKP
jgi:hypothetical protein